jgi:hypothetical protein
LSWVDGNRADYPSTGRGKNANPSPSENFDITDKMKFLVNGANQAVISPIATGENASPSRAAAT